MVTITALDGQEGTSKVSKVDVAIVGAGAGGIAVASSLLNLNPKLNVVVFDPSDKHYYQPGWSLVGAGILPQSKTVRDMASVIPSNVTWVKQAVETFQPDQQAIVLANGDAVTYKGLVVAAGIKVDFDAIPGLTETLGKNGVSSNYRFDLTPYTWECIKNLQPGSKAVFTMPPMPVKCAGAPQKILYLAADYWREQGILKDMSIHFRTAGASMFGVSHFVPILNSYMEKYGATPHFKSSLVRVDGDAKKATFSTVDTNGQVKEHDESFDFLHVVPPQCAPDFLRHSPLSNASGFVDVDQYTLQSTKYKNVFACGDCNSCPTSKTAAAIRKQAPTVARNLSNVLNNKEPEFIYDGYTSCPLTVERGKVVLAEFKYGGELEPTFPLNPLVPRWIWWQLKTKWLIPIYFDLMLKGREVLIHPQHK